MFELSIELKLLSEKFDFLANQVKQPDTAIELERSSWELFRMSNKLLELQDVYGV